jgi:hypothetical protein
MTTTIDRPRASTGPSTPPRRTGPSEPKRPGLGANSRLAWTLAVIGLAGTLVFGVAWLAGRGDGGGGAGTAQSGTTAELLAAAKSFSVALTNFDGATVDRDFDRIVARSTGEFRSQADQFFSTEIRTKLKAAQASSRGEVRSAFVQTADGERGTVFVVVDQTIANNQSPQPQADTLRMELGLVRKGDQWLVERVAVLTAPSGGSTATTASTPSGD